MPSFYDFSISLFVQRNIPPDKRMEPHVSWITVLLSGLKWLQKIALDWFINGLNPANYNPATAYLFGSTIYFNNKIYLKWSQARATGVSPTDTNGSKHWYFVMDGKYGVYTRLKFNGSKIILEGILNNYFGTTYRQPTAPPASHPLPDIYIVNNDSSGKYFTVYDGTLGTAVYNGPANAKSAVYDGVGGLLNQAQFTVMVPSSIFILLVGQSLDPVPKIRSVINPFVYAGINYDVQSY